MCERYVSKANFPRKWFEDGDETMDQGNSESIDYKGNSYWSRQLEVRKRRRLGWWRYKFGYHKPTTTYDAK